MLFVIIKSLLLSLNICFAGSWTSERLTSAQEVPFFKSTDSQFPSGSTTVISLEKQVVKTIQTDQNYYKWNKIYFAESELKPLRATHLSTHLIDKVTKERFKVLEANSKTALVTDENNKITKKIELTDFATDPYDKGYIITLKDVYLKSSNIKGAKILTTIPQGTRLIPNFFNEQFVNINYQNYMGYVDISEVVTKYDFASFIFAENIWQKVKKRNFNFIITTKNKKIELNTIKGILTHQNQGLIASSNQKIPLWSRLEISNDKPITWSQSKTKDYGLVWWKKPKALSEVYYSIDELLTQDISSVSFLSNQPLKGILSANGVYITNDGENWKKLSSFKDYNGPVHYFNENLILVGNYKSMDNGKTFENYIQVDKLADSIEKQFGFVPKKLQVKKIESNSAYKVKLEIQTSSKKIQMESSLFAQDWRPSKF